MKIEELDIKGFGTLINRKFSFPRTGVTILTGKNEAGKTTFLEFVRRMLFGFPTGRVASKEYEPITGLVKGGELSVIFQDGTRYTIHRVKASNRKIQQYLLLEDGTSASIEDLDAHMGKIRKDFYNRIFALTHLDLWNGGTLVNDNSVKDFLIGGLLSIKKSNPHVIAENCLKEANKLFLQRGSAPIINALIAEIKKINRKIREIEAKTEEYHDKSKKLEELQQEKKRLEEQELIVQKELSHYRMLSEARDSWVTIAQKKNELNEIIIPDTFSIDQDRRIEELQEKKREIDKELKRQIEKYDDLNLQIEQIISNEAILSKESEIIQINRLYQQYIADIGKLPTIRSKLSGKRRDLDIALEGLGPFWTEEKLDTIILTSEIKNALFTAKVTLENSERELLQINNHIKSLEEEIFRIKQDIPIPDKEKLTAADSIIEIKKTISEIQSLEQEATLLSRQVEEAQRRYDNSLSYLVNEGLEISPAFTTTFQYDAVSSSVRAFEEEIQNHEEQLRAYKTADTLLERDLNQCSDDQKETEATIESLGKIYPVDALKRRQKALYELKELLNRRDKRRESGISPGFASNFTIFALLFIGGFLCITAGFISGQFIFIGVGIGILLISGVLYLNDRNTQNIRAEEDDKLEQEIETYSKRLNIKILKSDEIDRIISQTELLSDRSRQAEALQITLSQILKRKAKSEENIQYLEGKLQEAKRELDITLQKWHAFLVEMLSPGLAERNPSPRNVYSLLSMIQVVSRESSEINRINQEIARIQNKKQAALAKCQEMLTPLIIIFSIEKPPADITELSASIDLITEQVQTELNKQERANTLLEEIKRRKQKIDQAHQYHTSISDRIVQERENFNKILTRSGLPAECNPDRLESLIQEVLAARTQYTGLKETQHELNELEKQIRSYEEQVYSLRQLIEESTKDSTINFLTERLVSLLSNEKDIVRKRDSIIERIKGCKERIDNQKKERELVQMEEESLLSESGVPDYNSYCEYRSMLQRKKNVIQEIDQEIAIINRICGDPQGYNQVSHELSLQSKDEVMAAIETGSSRVSKLREQISIIDREIGSIGTEIEILKQSEEHNRLLLERNIIHTSIHEYAQKWAVQTLAAELLRQSLEKFEREKQPAVVSKATEYFRMMTNGAYSRIILPISGDEFEVIMDNSIMKGPDILSQGTAEQLYISLRLAYATEYCLQNEPMPVVLDDILINCDEDRHARAIRAIGSVAEHTQVIYCTCHNKTVEQFSDILDDVHVIDLDSPDSVYQRKEDPDGMTIEGEGYFVL